MTENKQNSSEYEENGTVEEQNTEKTPDETTENSQENSSDDEAKEKTQTESSKGDLTSEEEDAIFKGLEGLDSIDEGIPGVPDLEAGEPAESADGKGEDGGSFSVDDLIASVKESSGFNLASDSPQKKNEEKTEAKPAGFPRINEETMQGNTVNAVDSRRIDMLLDIPVKVSVVLGRTRMSIGEVLSMEPGTVVELDTLVGEPVEILANDKLILRGEVVVIDENFGIRVTELVNNSKIQ